MDVAKTCAALDGILEILHNNRYIPVDENYLTRSHKFVFVYEKDDIYCFDLIHDEQPMRVWLEKDGWPVGICLTQVPASSEDQDSEDPPSSTGQ